MKKMKLLLSTAFMLNATFTLMAAFPTDPLSGGGDGTQASPYKIVTVNDLNEVRLAVSTAGGAGVGAAYYELSNDIDLSTVVNWAGLGAYNNAFRGNFDGKNHTISGVSIGTESEPLLTLTSGFFGFINGATISNLNVNIASYTSFAPTATSTGPSAGGLINTTTGSGNNIINNCKVTGVVNVISTNPANSYAQTLARAGGILGTTNTNVSGKTLIINCTSDVTVVAKNDATTNVTSPVAICGGIVGEVRDFLQTVEIVNCTAKGTVSAISTNFNSFAGGLVAAFYAPQPIVHLINSIAFNSVLTNGGANATKSIAGGILNEQLNANSYANNCIAMNSLISGVKASAGDPILNRIGAKSFGTFAYNYALESLAIQKTVQGVGPTTVTVLTNDAANKDGANLGVDAITDANTKLNDYVVANPTYSGITLNTWTNGGLTTLATPHTYALKPLEYSVCNGLLTVNNIGESKHLNLYTISGSLVNQMKVSGSFNILLNKGMYLIQLEGAAPTKVLVY